jgi:hypothetical protein
MKKEYHFSKGTRMLRSPMVWVSVRRCASSRSIVCWLLDVDHGTSPNRASVGSV